MKALYTFYFNRYPDTDSVSSELNKLSILRMILGLLLFYRCGQIVYSATFLAEFESAVIPGIAFLVLVALFTMGFLLPITTILTIICLPFFDATFQAATLGTAVAIQFLLILWLSNHGLRNSLDALILKGNSAFGRIVSRLYDIFGLHTQTSLKQIYMFGFLAYAVTSLGAILFHIQDHIWLSGETVEVFFTGSYLSRHFLFFRELVPEIPATYHYICMFMVLGQSIFQMFMIPLFAFKWGRVFVLVWSISFFIASLTLIQLSYLPHVELLFWIGIFYKPIGNGRWYNFKPKGVQKVSDIASKINLRATPSSILKIHLVVYFSYFVLYIIFRFPVTGEFTSTVLKRIHPSLNKTCDEFADAATYRFGLDLPLVFNESDLMMNEHWFVLYRLENNEKTLVTVHTTEGARLNLIGNNPLMLSNHGSDLLYFGTTLRYRRKIVKSDMAAFHKPGAFGWKCISRIAEFDRNYNQLSKETMYMYEVYQDRSVTGDLSDSTRFVPVVMFSDTLN